jgi:hypothetical protein
VVQGKSFQLRCPCCEDWFYLVVFTDTTPTTWHLVAGGTETELRVEIEHDEGINVLSGPEADRRWDA